MSRFEPVTPAQLRYIHVLARELDISASLVVREVQQRYRCLPGELNRGEASTIIDWLGSIRDGHTPRPVPEGQTNLFDALEEGKE